MSLIKTKTFELAIYAKGDPGSSKLAIIIPGRLDTKDYVHCTSLVDYLAVRGYYALAFDPPGTWESPGDIELCTTTNYLKAVDELIEYFGDKPALLIGHSRGGTIAMLAGLKNPQVTHFVSIMSLYGAPGEPKSYEKIVNNTVTQLRDLPPGTSPTQKKKQYQLPLNYFEDGKQYNALSGLKECRKPKLFFYSEQDVKNAPENVKEAYRVAAEPKMIYGVDSEHDYRLHAEIVTEVNETIGKFIELFVDNGSGLKIEGAGAFGG